MIVLALSPSVVVARIEALAHDRLLARCAVRVRRIAQARIRGSSYPSN